MDKKRKRYYFVDEAGDLTLFSKRGKVIVGSEGCSKYFILGVAQIENLHNTRVDINRLRSDILRDRYLTGIPSVLSKTKKSFHAKNDCPEVRREFFGLVKQLDVKVYCIVRRKRQILAEVLENNQRFHGWRYNQDSIYDSCVERLFKDRLHSVKVNQVTFSRRGKSKRNKTLLGVLDKAVSNFEKTYQKSVKASHKVASNFPSEEPCLQIIDYFLWALQRLYERYEDRYFNYVKEKFVRVIDLDDKRFNDYGVYYNKQNELTVNKIKDSSKG